MLPREQRPDHPRRKVIGETNAFYAELAEERGYTFLNIGPQLLESDGTLSQETAPDFCHLSESGYQVWADALRPLPRR